MHGFVVQYDESRTYAKAQTILAHLLPTTHITVNIQGRPFAVWFTTHFFFTNNTLSSLLLTEPVADISSFDHQHPSYVLVSFNDTLRFCADRFVTHSLLFDSNSSSLVISNILLPSTANPHLVYSLEPSTFTLTSTPKTSPDIHNYYLSLYHPRNPFLDDPAVLVDRFITLLTSVFRRLVPHSLTIPVLFSGGLDSSMVAYFALFVSDTAHVNLYTLSVQQNGSYDSPDRLCARASFADLVRLFPHRTIRLVEVDVTKQTAERVAEAMKPVVRPNNTVMDLSIATATALPMLESDAFRADVQALEAPFVLSGQGADEQLGGYGRHTTAFRAGRLAEELDRDVFRLWDRNVARDSRVYAFCGVRGVFPFLDDEVVRFCRNIPEQCLVVGERGDQNKWILREAARRVGMDACAMFKKTAIQFGSRLAKALNDNRKVKGGSSID